MVAEDLLQAPMITLHWPSIRMCCPGVPEIHILRDVGINMANRSQKSTVSGEVCLAEAYAMQDLRPMTSPSLMSYDV
jgi:hypothetical protein